MPRNMDMIPTPVLQGQKALILGIANEHSIAYGCARAFRTSRFTPSHLHPGPIKTRAAGGLKDFDLMLREAVAESPVHDLVDIDDVGMATACLAAPFAKKLTGSTLYVDAGLNIMS